MLLQGCVYCSNKTITQTTAIENIDWCNIPISKLPFEIDYPCANGYETLNEHIRNADSTINLNSIFGGFAKINEVTYYTGGINESVAFYKRLPDIGGNKVVIFSYQSAFSHYMEYPTFELQTFDKSNICIDKVIIALGLFDECVWRRSVIFNENYLIILKDSLVCYDSDSDENENDNVIVMCQSEDVHSYKINNNGFIVRYYNESVGRINSDKKDPWDNEQSLNLMTKGNVVNHLREGLWYIVEKYQFEQGEYIQGVGHYKQGVKDGYWIYFRYVNSNNIDSDTNLILEKGEFYENGKPTEINKLDTQAAYKNLIK